MLVPESACAVNLVRVRRRDRFIIQIGPRGTRAYVAGRTRVAARVGPIDHVEVSVLAVGDGKIDGAGCDAVGNQHDTSGSEVAVGEVVAVLLVGREITADGELGG